MNHYHPEDRPEPTEQPIRARVPDHVASGAFSTGVIVMTAQTEFILDFVQNLGRPHQIVARVVMPHNVLPQLVDALQRNMELYRSRWGELPNPQTPQPPAPAAPNVDPSATDAASAADSSAPLAPQPAAKSAGSASGGFAAGGASAAGGGGGGSETGPSQDGIATTGSSSPKPPGGNAGGDSGARQATAQEVYDDLKIRDEFLSGAYANAVMIGHGPHEFSFDFITNFYPHSAVSARVFLAAGQIPRLYDSLRGTWQQLKRRMQSGGNEPPTPESNDDY